MKETSEITAVAGGGDDLRRATPVSITEHKRANAVSDGRKFEHTASHNTTSSNCHSSNSFTILKIKKIINST